MTSWGGNSSHRTTQRRSQPNAAVTGEPWSAIRDRSGYREHDCRRTSRRHLRVQVSIQIQSDLTLYCTRSCRAFSVVHQASRTTVRCCAGCSGNFRACSGNFREILGPAIGCTSNAYCVEFGGNFREILGPAIGCTSNAYCVEFGESEWLSVAVFLRRFFGGRQMARTNRRDVLAAGEIQVVHCINRCVRRAYLCGQDPLTGTDYEHRRELIRQRLEFLAGIMGIEVLGYSVMSNLAG